MKDLVIAVQAVLNARKSNGQFVIPYGKLRDDLSNALHKVST